MTAEVAVAGGSAATALELARAGHHVTFLVVGQEPAGSAHALRAAGVDVRTAPEVDVRPTSPWLAAGYQLYRALAQSRYDAVVFPGNVADAYSVGQAKAAGSSLEDAVLVVDLDTPGLRTLRNQAFIEHQELGVAVTERLAVSLADVLVCSAETATWVRDEGWTLPRHVVVGDPAAGLERALAHRLGRRPAATRSAGGPLVSVVVTTYNRATYLAPCLESLARQDHPRLEVLVADDGSTDPVMITALDELEKRTWPWPLRVLRLPHGGAASARNGGWRASSGELIFFLDDDDVAFDDLVSRSVRAMQFADADVVIAAARIFSGAGPPTPTPGDRIGISLADPGELTLLGNHSGGSTCLWSREWLERLDGFVPTPRVFEDWHLLVRANLAGARIATPPDPAFWYRRTPTSMYASDPAGVVDASIPWIAGLVAGTLPPRASLLPHLVAGAYRELERRSAPVAPRRPHALSRARGTGGRFLHRVRRTWEATERYLRAR